MHVTCIYIFIDMNANSTGSADIIVGQWTHMYTCMHVHVTYMYIFIDMNANSTGSADRQRISWWGSRHMESCCHTLRHDGVYLSEGLCVCLERERESVCVPVCVCVRERERARERGRERERERGCVCVCVVMEL